MNRYDEIERQFDLFDAAHPAVWGLFVRFTLDRIGRGFKNYSANAIFERIRWETDEARTDQAVEFKMNNNYRAFYARKFMRRYPEYDGFFRLRKQTSEDRPAGYLTELTPTDFQSERI